uniref:Uncharacterized protein n=1 Tax=Anguilla anguilla TaxID=7936 RepID=A0A0E9RQ83_ANGAN
MITINTVTLDHFLKPESETMLQLLE